MIYHAEFMIEFVVYYDLDGHYLLVLYIYIHMLSAHYFSSNKVMIFSTCSVL